MRKHHAFPTFDPHPLLWNGHLQTLAGLFGAGQPTCDTLQHLVRLDDGDQTVAHDDQPASWQSGRRVALLVHGLGGSHQSVYMRRVAARLNGHGYRTFRLDMRCSGAATGLSKRPYHAGMSGDLPPLLRLVDQLCPGSPVTAIGFSMGGNIVLKLAGELGGRPCFQLDSVAAVNPPVDLERTVVHMESSESRAYRLHFMTCLRKMLADNRGNLEQARHVRWSRPPRSFISFDERFTAPLSGFGSAHDYYRQASCGRFLAGIRLPTLVLASRDDPLIPPDPLEEASLPACVRLELLDHGGHLGFISRGEKDPDRRWLDWRLLEWIGQLDERPRFGSPA